MGSCAEKSAVEDESLRKVLCEGLAVESGQVWAVGGHRVACGDARAAGAWDHVMLPGEMADVVWTDPPYGDHTHAGRGMRSQVAKAEGIEKIKGDELRGWDLTCLWYDALKDCPVRASSTLYFWATWKRQTEFWSLAHSLRHESKNWKGLTVQDMIVWAKPGLGLCHQMHPRYRRAHEICYWASVGDKYEFFGGMDQGDVWSVSRWRGERPAGHATPKPVALSVRALTNSARAGYTVCDPFAGTGTVLDACHAQGLKARLIELVPSYAQACVERAVRLTGCEPILVS